MLSCNSLCFSYNHKLCLKDVSFSFNENGIYGLLGRNGSGKSTLLKLISGLLPLQKGSIHILDESIYNAQRKLKANIRLSLGVLFQGQSSDEKLTAKDNLLFLSHLMGVKRKYHNERIKWVLKNANLTDYENVPLSKFSMGMKRRLEVYRTFLHYPKVVLLDEPTSYFDHKETKNFISFIKTYQKEHSALIFFSSHNSLELEHCDQLCMLDEGKLIGISSVNSLFENITKMKIRVSFREEGEKYFNNNKDTFGLFNVSFDKHNRLLTANLTKDQLKKLFESGDLFGTHINYFKAEQTSLLDAFENKLKLKR